MAGRTLGISVVVGGDSRKICVEDLEVDEFIKPFSCGFCSSKSPLNHHVGNTFFKHIFFPNHQTVGTLRLRYVFEDSENVPFSLKRMETNLPARQERSVCAWKDARISSLLKRLLCFFHVFSTWMGT